MHAAALGALCKKLAVAEGAVAESIKARQALLAGLEQLLESNKAKLEQEETQVSDLRIRKDAIESRRREVEEAILKGLSAAETSKISHAPLPVASASQERPQVEELTPPPMESFTPLGSPQQAAAAAPAAFEPVPDIGDDVMPEPVSQPIEPQAVPPPNNQSTEPNFVTMVGETNQMATADLIRHLQHTRPGQDGPVYGQQSYENMNKKRKMSRSTAEDEFAAFAKDGEMQGIDDNLQNLI